MAENKLRYIVSFLAFFGVCNQSFGQPDSLKPPAEHPKKGWSLGALPVLAYDADQGTQLGALAQVFDYGDGTAYPNYRQTIYGEASFFTRGSAIFRLFYDTKILIPGVRFATDITYLPEKALDFYGFNGYKANYNLNFEDENSTEYISGVFYGVQRRMFRFSADFQGNLPLPKLRWFAGLGLFDIRMATVDIDNLNKNRSTSHQLPDTALLWDYYVHYGLIREDEADGGFLKLLKLGLIFDSRDVETAPNKGIWAEAVLYTAPKTLDNRPYAFSKLSLTWRQYLSLLPDKVVLAYRLNYQGSINGKAPYYFNPVMFSAWYYNTKTDGLGGAKTMRGVQRDRAVADGIALANAEIRWKCWRTQVLKQNFYLALLGFLDTGVTVQETEVDETKVPYELQPVLFHKSKDGLHSSWGLGIRATLNENFMVSADYGRAFNPQDGKGGFYIGLGHLF